MPLRLATSSCPYTMILSRRPLVPSPQLDTIHVNPSVFHFHPMNLHTGLSQGKYPLACEKSKTVQISEYKKGIWYTLPSTQYIPPQMPLVPDYKFDGFWTKYFHDMQILHF
jgi:hypothetical protein